MAARIFLGTASFPFFNNLDEFAHADAIHRYAHLRLPASGGDRFEPHMIGLNWSANSPEFVLPPDADGRYPPHPRDLPPDLRQRGAAAEAQRIADWRNYQLFSPPLYYATSACAWRAAHAANGGDDIGAFYWVRFLNVIACALAVVLAYRFVRLVRPDLPFLWIGVPCLLVAFPQDVYYGINSDVPALFLYPLALAFLCRLAQRPRNVSLGVAAGACVAVAYLVKATASVLVAVAALMLAVALWRAWRTRERGALRGWGAAALTAVVPIAAWCTYNRIATGYWSGLQHKVEILDFLDQTWDGLIAHPIFTPSGFWTFLSNLTETLWRGELFWHGAVMQHDSMDVLYVATSLVFLAASAAATLRRAPEHLGGIGVLACWATVCVAVASCIAASVGWQYSDTTGYPSPEYPFFTSGRHVNGAIVPFLVLYVDGLRAILRRLGPACWIALGALIVAIVVSELLLTAPVLQSSFNWWHRQ